MKYTYTIIYTNIYSNTFSKAQVIWDENLNKTNTQHTQTLNRNTHTDRQRKTRGAGYWTKMENKTYIFIQINKNTFSGITE